MKMNHQYSFLQQDIYQDEEILRGADAIKNYQTSGNESILIENCGKSTFYSKQNFEHALVARGELPWIVAIYRWDNKKATYEYTCVDSIVSSGYMLTGGNDNPVLCYGSSSSPIIQLISEPIQEPYYILKGLLSAGLLCADGSIDICIDIQNDLEWIYSIIN